MNFPHVSKTDSICNLKFINHFKLMMKNQISDKQIEANRMNALKSTGPRSIEGKEKSAQNALKFGFTAKKFIIPDEERKDFDEYHQKMIDVLKPNTILTEEMVLNISMAFWKSRRYANLESVVVKISQLNELEKYSQPFSNNFEREIAENQKIKNEPICMDVDLIPPAFSFDIKSLGKLSSMQNQECNRALRLLKQYINVRSLEENDVVKDKESNYPLEKKN